MERVGCGTIAPVEIKRCTAPWAACDYKPVLCRLRAIGDLADTLHGLLEAIRARASPYPHPDCERLLAEACWVLAPQQLQCTYHARCSVELLASQQAERVAHECDGSATGVSIPQPPPDKQEDDQAQIRLRFPTACGEPDEIEDVAMFIVFVDGRP